MVRHFARPQMQQRACSWLRSHKIVIVTAKMEVPSATEVDQTEAMTRPLDLQSSMLRTARTVGIAPGRTSFANNPIPCWPDADHESQRRWSARFGNALECKRSRKSVPSGPMNNFLFIRGPIGQSNWPAGRKPNLQRFWHRAVSTTSDALPVNH